jgi:hypothetical protein
MIRGALIAILGFALVWCSGCSAGSTAQLDKYQTWEKTEDFKSIVDTPVVSCSPSDEACGRLHAIHADACLQLAMKDRAPGAACPRSDPEIRNMLDCAATEYSAAQQAAASAKFTSDQLAIQSANRAGALYCDAELQDTVSAGAALALEAKLEADKASEPQRQLIGGRAALYLAKPGVGDDPSRCKNANEAERQAAAGLNVAGDAAARSALERLQSDANMRMQQIPNCRS